MRKLSPLLFVFLGLGLGFVLFKDALGLADGPSPNIVLGSSSGFTYQGRLDIEGTPAVGSYDFQFTLYDLPGGGVPVADAVTESGVAVTDGLFSVILDFGGDVFDGSPRYLQIGVREAGSTEPYHVLTPRQQLTAALYALHATEADSAPWSGLSGVPQGFADGSDDGLTSVGWNDVQNKPAGFADGADDNTTYTAGAGLVLAGTQFAAQGSPYDNVLIVAQSGGDFDSVQAALDSITDASADNPYLVTVAPGVYSETVTLKPYITLQGAGEGATIIHGTGGGAQDSNSATLVGADNTALRHLTVDSDGTGEQYAIAIYNDGASPTISHVTATALGGAISNAGVYNTNASSPNMTSLTATASGGNASQGVYNRLSSSPKMTNMTATASGGSFGYGVSNFVNCSPKMTNVTATASGDSSSYGLFNQTASARIHHSVLNGDTNSINIDFFSTAQVANSQLIGDVGGGGSATCFNNYDQNLDPINCP